MQLFMIMDVKKILKEEGQAIMEFILFLPFMMMMYFAILSISGAINASINQQKITRGYFYYRLGHNSTMPRPRRDGQEPSSSWSTFGMQIMGWAEDFVDNNNPVAPCFALNIPFAELGDETCQEAYTKDATKFIRVQTVYGVCGATYTKFSNNNNIRHPDGGAPTVAIGSTACQLVE